ncbi:MAG: hypothetical protein JWN17_2049 [Frankiales bacterium]|nr:hypothetical protein [Frankiales bacterium]
MPTYQYRCTSCEQPLEAVQSFSDAALTECPACGGRLRKVYGSVGVVFKGSGFYKTDSRAESKGSGGGSGGDSAKPAESSPSSTPSTDKPAASTPAPAAASSSTPAASSTPAGKSA